MRTPPGRWPSASPIRSANNAETGWNPSGFADVVVCVGEPDTARVDVATVLDAARQYDAASDIVDAAIRTHLTGLRFDGAVAGRIHTAQGDALRLALNDLEHRLHEWARAAAEIAAELRSCADRYGDVDHRSARRIG